MAKPTVKTEEVKVDNASVDNKNTGLRDIPKAFNEETMPASVEKEKLQKEYEIPGDDDMTNDLKPASEAGKIPKEKKEKSNNVDENDSEEDDNEGEKEDEKPENDENEEGDEDTEKETDEEEEFFDERLIKKAYDLGLEDNDILEFDSNNELEKHLKVLEKTVSKLKIPAAKPRIPAVDVNKNKDDEESDLELNLDLIDPEIAKTLKNRDKQNQIKIKQLENLVVKQTEILKSIHGKFQENEDAKINTAFDDLILETVSKEGNEVLKKELGEGRYFHENFKKTNQFKNRASVFKEMEALRIGYENVGIFVDQKTLFERAINIKYPGLLKQEVKSNIKKSIIKNRKTFSIKPTHREAEEIPVKEGRKAAIAAVAEEMKKIIAKKSS